MITVEVIVVSTGTLKHKMYSDFWDLVSVIMRSIPDLTVDQLQQFVNNKTDLILPTEIYTSYREEVMG
jgi:hypothetical protein